LNGIVKQGIVNWKGYGRKQLWLNLRFHAIICLERLRKTTKASVSITSLPWDLNLGPPEYKAGVQTTAPWRLGRTLVSGNRFKRVA
jgi:hypothetical protein